MTKYIHAVSALIRTLLAPTDQVHSISKHGFKVIEGWDKAAEEAKFNALDSKPIRGFLYGIAGKSENEIVKVSHFPFRIGSDINCSLGIDVDKPITINHNLTIYSSDHFIVNDQETNRSRLQDCDELSFGNEKFIYLENAYGIH